jgi:hypothetical protein
MMYDDVLVVRLAWRKRGFMRWLKSSDGYALPLACYSGICGCMYYV